MTHLKTIFGCAAAASAMLLSSCVHEFPEFSQEIGVQLTFHHELGWTEYDYLIDSRTRSAGSEHQPRYTLFIYPEGSTTAPAYTHTFYTDDKSLKDFTTTIALPPGRWDIHVWQDHKPADDMPYYNIDDLSAITYTLPYYGDIEEREAFEGKVTVEVPETYEENVSVSGTVNMARPMGRYVFIATDFEKFYNETLTRYDRKKVSWKELPAYQKEEILKGYSIVALYPYYMPSTYNYFTQRVTDSSTGMRYDASLTPLNEHEAKVASDHVFMNHHESGTQVQLGLKTPDGQLLQLTDVITVPMKRGQTTYVRGKFLTAGLGNGLDIDFDFSGDINIEIK